MYYFRFLLQVIGKCAETLSREKVAVGASACNTQFLLQQVTHLMLYITHMFQSGEKGLTHTVSPVVCMDAVSCLSHTCFSQVLYTGLYTAQKSTVPLEYTIHLHITVQSSPHCSSVEHSTDLHIPVQSSPCYSSTEDTTDRNVPVQSSPRYSSTEHSTDLNVLVQSLPRYSSTEHTTDLHMSI